MDLSKYRNKLIGSEDERAVSPVIGVILMVAITVILAAVIAAFVLDIGDLGNSEPQAQLSWDATSSDLTVEHSGGDDIETANVDVQINGSGTGTLDTHGSAPDTFSAGESITLNNADESSEVTLTWDTGDGSTILTEY